MTQLSLGNGYTFIKSPISPGHFNFEPFFFLSPSFLTQSAPKTTQHHYWLVDNRNMCEGHFVVQQSDNSTEFSGISTPFTGFQLTEGINRVILQQFIDRILDDLRKSDAKSVTLRLAPNSYNGIDTTFLDLLVHTGFETIYTDTNQHLLVNNKPFRESLDGSNKNKLNKAHRDSITFSFSDSEGTLREAFDLIRKNRTKNGYPLTMTLEKFNEAFKSFPEKYFLSTGQVEGTIISVIISIQVTSRIIYHFYMADDHNWRNISPLVAHNDFLYTWSRQEGYTQIDLGTSSEKGILNPSLFDFKKHLGAFTSEKHNLTIKL